MKDVVGKSGHPSGGSQESAPIDSIAPQQVSSPEPHNMVSGGRRRGRRKIMKKKTLKDDEGYLGSYTLQLDRYMSRGQFTAIRCSSLLIPIHSYERRTSMGVIF